MNGTAIASQHGQHSSHIVWGSVCDCLFDIFKGAVAIGLMCLIATAVLLPSRLYFGIELFVQLMSVHFMKGTGTLLILVMISAQTNPPEHHYYH